MIHSAKRTRQQKDKIRKKVGGQYIQYMGILHKIGEGRNALLTMLLNRTER